MTVLQKISGILDELGEGGSITFEKHPLGDGMLIKLTEGSTESPRRSKMGVDNRAVAEMDDEAAGGILNRLNLGHQQGKSA
jgi:hypothetical protein